MSLSNETLADLAGEVTGLVYRIAGNTLIGPPAGEVLGPIADDAGRGVAEDALQAVADIGDGDLSAIPDLGKILVDPVGAANQQLIEDIPLVGPVLGEAFDALGAIPGIGGLFG